MKPELKLVIALTKPITLQPELKHAIALTKPITLKPEIKHVIALTKPITLKHELKHVIPLRKPITRDRAHQRRETSSIAYLWPHNARMRCMPERGLIREMRCDV